MFVISIVDVIFIVSLFLYRKIVILEMWKGEELRKRMKWYILWYFILMICLEYKEWKFDNKLGLEVLKGL